MRRGQLSFKLDSPVPKGRGGARPGAGRPRVPENRRGYVIHSARPEIRKATPVHVTLRLADGRPSFRRKEVFRILRSAVATARLKGLQVVHFSILSNHLHLLVEADDGKKLSRSIQSLAISFARRLNRLMQSEGAVFSDRYHLRLLRSPSQVRNALAYVHSNESRHSERGLGTHFVGPYSSGHAFDGWRELFGKRYRFRVATDWSVGRLERWLAEILVAPRTWLLKEGWKRARSCAPETPLRTRPQVV